MYPNRKRFATYPPGRSLSSLLLSPAFSRPPTLATRVNRNVTALVRHLPPRFVNTHVDELLLLKRTMYQLVTIHPLGLRFVRADDYLPDSLVSSRSMTIVHTSILLFPHQTIPTPYPNTSETTQSFPGQSQVQAWGGPPPEASRVLTAYSPPDHLQDPPAVLAAPSVFLPPLFSSLARVDPNSIEFRSILKQFLQSKEEHKLLTQLEGLAAVYVADILDKVRNHCATAPREA